MSNMSRNMLNSARYTKSLFPPHHKSSYLFNDGCWCFIDVHAESKATLWWYWSKQVGCNQRSTSSKHSLLRHMQLMHREAQLLHESFKAFKTLEAYKWSVRKLGTIISECWKASEYPRPFLLEKCEIIRVIGWRIMYKVAKWLVHATKKKKIEMVSLADIVCSIHILQQAQFKIFLFKTSACLPKT